MRPFSLTLFSFLLLGAGFEEGQVDDPIFQIQIGCGGDGRSVWRGQDRDLFRRNEFINLSKGGGIRCRSWCARWWGSDSKVDLDEKGFVSSSNAYF
jgi:hypothetical protein